MRRLIFLPLISLLLAGCGVTNCTLSPSVTGQPTNQTVAVGQPALFTVAASGTAPVSYQWLKNGTAISGATAASYTTAPTTQADSGSMYAVTISNRLGKLTSLPASLTVTSAQPTTNLRFVATDGSDSNAGSIDQPYRTIQHCVTTVPSGWTCEVRAGTYRETVTPNSGVTITAYNLEAVTVDGSDPISDWSLDHDNVYKANVTLRSDDTNQIFVGSEMMTEARWPNGDDLFAINWSTAGAGTDAGHVVDSKIPSGDWTGAKIHLWSGSDPFGQQTGSITGSSAGQVSIDVGQTASCPSICPTSGGLYYLFGSRNALDVEREWYYDSAASTLYFMAPGGVSPSTVDVRGKQRDYAFDLRGKSGVTIRNIAIFASTIVTDESSANNTLDRINAQYVSHFTLLPPTPGDAGGFSILTVHDNDTGIILDGTGNMLENSTISYSAGSGVALLGSGSTVRNNLIENIDYVGAYPSGIVLLGTGDTIQYNTIENNGRQGIFVEGVVNEDIGYNNLFNAMLLSRDGGEIYACCNQLATGTRIHHNWIHDTEAVVKGQGDQYALAGVDIDNGSAGFAVDQNVLWDNKFLNIAINGAGAVGAINNFIENNTIPDSSPQGRIQITNIPDCSGTSITGNRVTVKVFEATNGTACNISNNDIAAPGATEMSSSTGVGCNFSGCSSSGPPAILEGGSLTACGVNVFARP